MVYLFEMYIFGASEDAHENFWEGERGMKRV